MKHLNKFNSFRINEGVDNSDKWYVVVAGIKWRTTKLDGKIFKIESGPYNSYEEAEIGRGGHQIRSMTRTIIPIESSLIPSEMISNFLVNEGIFNNLIPATKQKFKDIKNELEYRIDDFNHGSEEIFTDIKHFTKNGIKDLSRDIKNRFKPNYSICKELGITNYSVNSDGSIDVDGDVRLQNSKLQKLPLKFRKVSGSFNCSFNKLTTLEGAPLEVGGNFNCSENYLTSLEGAPLEVGLHFFCRDNELINLEGAPRKIVGRFDCKSNPIYEVYRLFRTHIDYMDSVDYNYLRGDKIDKRRFKEALDEFGIDIPESIPGYEWI